MMLLTKDIVNISLVLRLKLYLIFVSSHASGSNTNKGFTVLVGRINLHSKEKIGLLLHNGKRNSSVENA